MTAKILQFPKKYKHVNVIELPVDRMVPEPQRSPKSIAMAVIAKQFIMGEITATQMDKQFDFIKSYFDDRPAS